MAARKRKRSTKSEELGAPSTVRFPRAVEQWLLKEGEKNPRGKTGVIRDAVHEHMKRKQAEVSVGERMVQGMSDG
jgi:hypothetical protein